VNEWVRNKDSFFASIDKKHFINMLQKWGSQTKETIEALKKAEFLKNMLSFPR